MRLWQRVVLVGAVVLVGVLVVLPRLDDTPKAVVTRPMVAMPDGVRLAVDVVLPEGATRVPVILIQARYWRSLALKVPDNPGRVPKGPREPIVEALVRAGFGVVVADVRGTGASEGHWPHPFGEQEARDGAALLEWIARQPFCDGRIGATGVSYEGTTALLTAAAGNPALRAVLARQIEWDLVDELIAPGGVQNRAFHEAWSRSVRDLDRGVPPELFPTAARWVVKSVHPVDGDDGTALSQLQRDRTVVDVAAALANVRSPADAFGDGGVPLARLGPAAHAEALSKTSAVVSLWGSWWDAATADGVLRASAAMPVSEAVIGPWAHEGDSSASPFGHSTSEHLVHLDAVVDFFRRTLTQEQRAPVTRRWWVAGAERWESAADWPTTRSESLPVEFEADSLSVDFAASTGLRNRWMTGMALPVEYEDRRSARGVLRSTRGSARTAPLRFFGAPVLQCRVTLDGPEAALHVMLEEERSSGEFVLLTEGVQRVTGGEVNLRLRPLAAELPVGGRLRLTVAGADAPTFERVPREGQRRVSFDGPCRLELPLREQAQR